MNRRSLFGKAHRKYKDVLVSDFSDPTYQRAFKKYCVELGLAVTDWHALFKEIDADGDTKAYIRTDGNGEVIGFIQFRPETFRSRFFEETCGFIREFWVDRECRRLGHGSELLLLTEAYFAKQGITTCVLTVGDGARFYERRGYKKSPSLKAKNDLDVYVKRLK